MDVERKKPTPVYQPFIKELVIADLQDAARSGSFDKDVLLFQQDGYVARALGDKAHELREQFALINIEVLDGQERESRKRQAVICATQALYAELKEQGDETTGVRGFAGAAAIYLNGAIVDYHTYLLDLAEHVDRAVVVGHSPDINWLAGHTYAAVAKASQTIGLIEAALGQEQSIRGERVLEQGMRAVGSANQDGVALGICKRIWQGVSHIEANPAAHVVNDNGVEIGQEFPIEDPWDIDPIDRQEFEP